VRSLARSGVRVTAASQGAVQSLIELQEDIVTSALNDAAAQMQRLAYTESVRDLARVQGEILQAARQRIVDDIARAVTVLKSAAGDVRKAAERAEAAKPAKARPKAKAKAKAKVTVRAKSKAAPRTKRKARKSVRRART
jgi:phasin family protein